MKKSNIRKWFGFIFLTVILAIPFITPLQSYITIPNHIVTTNTDSPIDVPSLGSAVDITPVNKSIQAIDDTEFHTVEPGANELVYEASGIPIKKVSVSVLEDIEVIPGGQSIGVQLHTLGVLVVGHHLVNTDKTVSSPGEDAAIQVGDVILKINDEPIKKMEDVKPFVKQAGKDGKPLDLTIKRDEDTIETTLEPALDEKENEYQIGLYIRDSAAGIGTLSFMDPKSKRYGALGHVISDMDTKKPIQIHDGSIVRSSITSIEKGDQGTPGEKQAKFSMRDSKIGTINKNNAFGVFGKLDELMKNDTSYDKPMSIALSHEVKEGPAKILTVLKGEKVEAFDVEIVSSVPQKKPATKGMVVKVTDPKLLNETGGIVQGMSGSPIIQDDKIIGAVTHVFVNDPTSGYGVHIEWMLQEAGVPEKENVVNQQKAS